jgi:hypothetical protein
MTRLRRCGGRSSSGTRIHGREALLEANRVGLYVFAHHDGRWWIVARQNTAIS